MSCYHYATHRKNNWKLAYQIQRLHVCVIMTNMMSNPSMRHSMISIVCHGRLSSFPYLLGRNVLRVSTLRLDLLEAFFYRLSRSKMMAMTTGFDWSATPRYFPFHHLHPFASLKFGLAAEDSTWRLAFAIGHIRWTFWSTIQRIKISSICKSGTVILSILRLALPVLASQLFAVLCISSLNKPLHLGKSRPNKLHLYSWRYMKSHMHWSTVRCNAGFSYRAHRRSPSYIMFVFPSCPCPPRLSLHGSGGKSNRLWNWRTRILDLARNSEVKH